MKTENPQYRVRSLRGHVLRPLNEDQRASKTKHLKLWELPIVRHHAQLRKITVKLT